MSNELTKEQQNVIDFITKTADIEGGELSKLGADFCPLLTVASGLSESVTKGIANVGEWVLGKETSLGTEIEAVPLAYRSHAALIDTKSFEFVESQYVLMGQKPTEAYRAFCVMQPPAGHKIQVGADIIMYIPKVSNFGQIFMQKTLAKYAQPIWSAGKGGRLVKLSTFPMTNRLGTRKWTGINIFETKQSLKISKLQGYSQNIPMDIDIYTKYLNQFSNPVKSAAETVSEDTQNTIER